MNRSAFAPSDFAAVIFDLDGTLYTLPKIGFHIAVGMPFSARALRNLFPVRDEMRGQDYEDIAQFKKVFADKLGARSGLSPEKALTWYEERFMTRFVRVLAKRGKVRPGLVELLETLRSRGTRLAVVSDFGRVRERLDALRIEPTLFDEALGAEDLGVMKPTAKPFLHILSKWGISPDKTVLVGDRLDHDLGSAELLGAFFLGIENKRNQGGAFMSWDRVISSLAGDQLL